MHKWTPVLLLLASVGVAGQNAPDTAALVESVGQYARDYPRRLAGIIGEEHQLQRLIKADGTTSKERRLVSDVAVITVGDRLAFFRDVAVVDGKTVRNREARLRRLFLGESRDVAAQVRRIFDESRRHDLKFMHWSTALLLPLVVAKPENHGRFRFMTTDDGLSFEEVSSPTLSRAGQRDRLTDMPLRGRLVIERATGTIRAGTFAAANQTMAASVEVRYVDTAFGVLVPADLREQYQHPDKPNGEHMEITSEYSNFRRFEVKVDTNIDLPQ